MNLLQALKLGTRVKRRSMGIDTLSIKESDLLEFIRRFKQDLMADDWIALKEVEIDEPLEESLTAQVDTSSSKTWTDSTRLIWYPALEGVYTYNEALAKAKELGLRLPTKEEFERAEAEGIRSKFDDFKGKAFWSSSPHPDYSSSAYVFSGDDGRILSDLRDYYSAVRCVKDKV